MYHQYFDMINRSRDRVHFDFFQNQKRVGKYFVFFHEALQQLFTRQQLSDIISVRETFLRIFDFQFLAYLHVLECPEHGLNIFRKCLSVLLSAYVL